MSVRYLLAQSVVDAGTWTPGRIAGTIALVLALAGVVVGGLALARSARRIGNNGKRGAVVALVAGLGGTAVGGYVVAAAEGGPGTGYGVVGGFGALAIGLVAMLLGGLALVRSNRLTSRVARHQPV